VRFLEVNKIVYVDESGLNREYQNVFARAKRGVKIYDTKSGKRQKRTNIIAGLMCNISDKTLKTENEGYLAVQCYEHSTTSAFFEDWFEFELIPLLPKDVSVVMDNAAFHNKKRLWKIAERYEINLLFLPPYSPEMNPIEQIWKEIRKEGFKNEFFNTLDDVVVRLSETICKLTRETIKSITGRDWILEIF